MPQPIAQAEHAPSVVTGKKLFVLVQVGDVGEIERQAALFRLDHIGRGVVLDRTQQLGEG